MTIVHPTTPTAMLTRTVALAAGVLLVLSGAPAPAAADPPAPTDYRLTLRALTGPRGADLAVAVSPQAGLPAVDELKKVQLKIHGPDGKLADVRNLTDVPAPGGLASILLGELPRDRLVDVQILLQSTPSRTHVLREETRTLLRPDLVVEALRVPAQTLTTRPVDVTAELAELNGDSSATAEATLMWGPTPLAGPSTVEVPAGGRFSVTFPQVELEQAVETELTVVLGAVSPAQTDETNDRRTQTVQVTEHELVRANVLVPSLGGYGAQFNQHVYAPITNAPPASLPDMEAKAKALEPQLVRIFYNDNWEERRPEAPQNMASFLKTVELAHEAGATINVTYHTLATARAQPVASMATFAAVLEDLVERRGLTSVRWVTIGNEPNSTTVTLPEYEALHRALHAQLVARGLDQHVRMMGGDLVEGPVGAANDHRNWFRYMAEHMNDILDAYSVHIYWTYHDVPRMEFRLKDVHKIITEELPVAARKPTYIMEFAVRGRDPFPAKPVPRFAFYEDGTEMRRTTLAGFQTLWFFLESAQLGYTGTAKWDAYWGMYDLSSPNNQSYWMTGSAAEGWPLFPTYHSLYLLLQSTQRGWHVVQVAPWEEDDWKVGVRDQPEKEIAAFASTEGHLTLMGLDTHGRALNAVSAETPEYSIGGLPPLTEFTLALWNETGNGENTVDRKVKTDAAGVARFEVPLHAAFALTTVPTS